MRLHRNRSALTQESSIVYESIVNKLFDQAKPNHVQTTATNAADARHEIRPSAEEAAQATGADTVLETSKAQEDVTTVHHRGSHNHAVSVGDYDPRQYRRRTTLPFAHLNLRRNPFGEITAEETAALAYVNVDGIVAKLCRSEFAVQFIGDKGFGKTTHLLAIRARFSDAGYVHIPEGERAEIPVGSPLLIDEAQRLTWRQRRQVFRSSTPLVLGTHVDSRKQLARAGRVVETVAVDGQMDAERLCALLNARIDRCRRHEGELPRIRLETARQLLQQFGPNVRRILHELYVTIQNLHRIQDV